MSVPVSECTFIQCLLALMCLNVNMSQLWVLDVSQTNQTNIRYYSFDCHEVSSQKRCVLVSYLVFNMSQCICKNIHPTVPNIKDVSTVWCVPLSFNLLSNIIV